MRFLALFLILFVLTGCSKPAGKITGTTVSVYLNTSNCTIYEKIMSGALANHQIIIMQSSVLPSLIRSNQADGELLKFFTGTFSEKQGILSEDDKDELSRLQSEHVAWAHMTVMQQEFVSDLVFKGCTENH